jgi:hypothetical protein
MAGPKSHVPRAFAISMPTGFIEALTSPAISVLCGGLGRMPAKMRTSGPIQVNPGSTECVPGIGSQCHRSPIPNETMTKYQSPWSSRARGGAFDRRMWK